MIFTDPYVYMQYLNTTPHRVRVPRFSALWRARCLSRGTISRNPVYLYDTSCRDLGKYVVYNFICLCFMVEGSYVIIYTQDHKSSLERGCLRITLCRHQEDMKKLLPIHHHHHLQHRVRTIICTELHSPIECCLIFFCDL